MKLLPFSYQTIIRNSLNNSKTLLDVGCGNGKFMTEINEDKKFTVTGVDLFEPYIKEAKKTRLYKEIIKKDIRKLSFKSNSFDAVLSSQVVEHFKKKESLQIIKQMEKFAKHTIVIGTPNGHFHQEAYDHNDLQEHLSEWYPKDFIKIGYTVYGQGLRFVYGENGLLHTVLGKFFVTRVIIFIFSYLLSPFVYYFPQFSTYLIAVKKK